MDQHFSGGVKHVSYKGSMSLGYHWALDLQGRSTTVFFNKSILGYVYDMGPSKI